MGNLRLRLSQLQRWDVNPVSVLRCPHTVLPSVDSELRGWAVEVFMSCTWSEYAPDHQLSRQQTIERGMLVSRAGLLGCGCMQPSLGLPSSSSLQHSAQCQGQHGTEGGWECQIPLPVLESQLGSMFLERWPSRPCTSARTHAHTSGMTSALPPSVPCVSLTGQCPGVINHEQISHSQREARRTQGGDTAIKATSTNLARQTKAQLIGNEQASSGHCSVALQSDMGHVCFLRIH